MHDGARENGRKKHNDVWDKIQVNLEAKGIENYSWKWLESHRTKEEAITAGEYEEWYRNDQADQMAQKAAEENSQPNRIVIKYKNYETSVRK